MSSSFTRPFLKWPGGKFRLLGTLTSQLPDCAYLVEPFVGAGALFLNTTHQKVIVNDINPDLINLYKQIQNTGLRFIRDAKKLFTQSQNKSIVYYRNREKFNLTSDEWERALLFLYLNRHGYNGLCRYNLKGLYNVPFGAYVTPYFPQDELEFFYNRSQNVVFHCKDYAALFKQLSNHSKINQMVIYCDPPYAPLSKTANFTGYAAHRFTLDDQKKLAVHAKALAQKGAIVLISNHDTPFTREIYQEATLEKLTVSRTISCKGMARQKVKEVIAIFAADRLSD